MYGLYEYYGGLQFTKIVANDKETLYKMIGQEDVDFRQHLHVCPFYYELEGTFHVYETRTDKKKEFNLRYWVQPEFVVVYSDNIKKEN